MELEARLVEHGDLIQGVSGDWLKVLTVELTAGGQPSRACIHAYAEGQPTQRVIVSPNAQVQVQR